jgi:hypothetical protein
MVRRRSTVRFRNGAPAQRNNSNSSNGPRGPFRGPSSSHIEPRGASVCLRFAKLCGLGGSLVDLLDCAEDHRRGALDGPAHKVPWAVAVMYLGEPPVYRYGLAVRAGGHVAASQNAGQRIRCGVELGAQDVGESAFAGFDDGAGVVCDQPAQLGIGVLGLAQIPGAIELVQACHGLAGRVADVVQPGSGFQETGVRAENTCQGEGPACECRSCVTASARWRDVGLMT